MTATTRSGGRTGTAVLWVILVIGGLLAVGALAVPDEDAQTPYDTDSTTATGTRAFVELLESFGTEVDVPSSFAPDDTDADIVLLFQDATTLEQTDALQQWVRTGGTLVVTDPYSTLVPLADFESIEQTGQGVAAGTCTVDALAEVDQIEPDLEGDPQSVYAPGLTIGDGDTSCFGTDEVAFVVVTRLGAGQVVGVASGSVFMNGALGQVDNAALATSLFAARPGTRLAVVEPSAFGAADGAPVDRESAGSLDAVVGAGMPFLLLQVVVAVVVLGLAQGRRLGRPVAEPQPVQIAGSELVRAMGDLLEQAASPTNAAAVLRADLRREICLRVGLPPTTSVEIVAATVDARTGIGRDRVLAVIADHPVANDRELVELARSIDSIREEILHVPSA